MVVLVMVLLFHAHDMNNYLWMSIWAPYAHSQVIVSSHYKYALCFANLHKNKNTNIAHKCNTKPINLLKLASIWYYGKNKVKVEGIDFQTQFQWAHMFLWILNSLSWYNHHIHANQNANFFNNTQTKCHDQ